MTTKEVKCERKKVKVVMHEYKEGSLKRRNSKPVKSRKEAVAIALNIARRKCSRKKSKKSKK